jgi:hypothetical protein
MGEQVPGKGSAGEDRLRGTSGGAISYRVHGTAGRRE